MKIPEGYFREEPFGRGAQRGRIVHLFGRGIFLTLAGCRHVGYVRNKLAAVLKCEAKRRGIVAPRDLERETAKKVRTYNTIIHAAHAKKPAKHGAKNGRKPKWIPGRLVNGMWIPRHRVFVATVEETAIRQELRSIHNRIRNAGEVRNR